MPLQTCEPARKLCGCKALSFGVFAHASGRGENCRNEWRMFNIENLLFVTLTLLLFVLSKGQVGWPVWRRVRVEDSNIDKSALKPTTPNTTCCHIQMGLILLDGRPMAELLLGDWLKVWLNSNIDGHSFQETCWHIPNLTMSKAGESPSCIGQSMAHWKCRANYNGNGCHL